MLKIGIMGGSTRPSQKASAVGEWVSGILKSREEEEFELVDITDCKPLSSMTVTADTTPLQQDTRENMEREDCLTPDWESVLRPMHRRMRPAERVISMRGEPGPRAFTPTIEEEPA
jgi:hypothetical protein